MTISFRQASDGDFDYCKRLYFEGMEWIIKKLQLNRAAQEVGFEKQWDLGQIRIIELDDSDVGWLQVIEKEGEIFLGQLFVDRPFQRRGIGTHAMKHLIGEAERLHQTMQLSVAKINPAVRLYERMGFHFIREDDRKFYMKRDPTTR